MLILPVEIVHGIAHLDRNQNLLRQRDFHIEFVHEVEQICALDVFLHQRIRTLVDHDTWRERTISDNIPAQRLEIKSRPWTVNLRAISPSSLAMCGCTTHLIISPSRTKS